MLRARNELITRLCKLPSGTWSGKKVKSSILLSMPGRVQARRFDAFLSYSRQDDAGFRDSLRQSLTSKGICLWFDRESLANRGMTFDAEIRNAIESSDRLILLAGPGALASDYVRQEWGFAEDLGIPILPLILAGDFNQLPEPLRFYHSVDGRVPATVDSAVAELLRLLSEPVPQLGTCYSFPFRPPHELAREALQSQLWDAIGLDRQRPMDAGRAQRTAVLYGLSGVGKSTIAAAFGRTIRCRRAFPDGIAWIRCGSEFKPLSGAREVLSQIAPGAQLPDVAGSLQRLLVEGLAAKRSLIILDDLHDPNAAAPFVSALGPDGRALIIALDQSVATALDAVEIPVESLDEASACRLLESWAGGPLPNEAEQILFDCDGLPFALAIVGAMIQQRVSWARVAQLLGARRLDLLGARFPTYQHRTLLRALAASYDALRVDEPQAAECYIELAAFHRGAEFSEQVLIRLWSRPGRLDEFEASLIAPVLERRLLLHAQPNSDPKRFVLHRLHDDFVRLECRNALDLETALVETYRVEKGAADWWTLVDDGYVFDHLIGHLAALKQFDDLFGAINSTWVRRQFERKGDLRQALDDAQVAMDIAAQPPVDFAKLSEVALLSGEMRATLRAAPAWFTAALAAIGDTYQAIHWAADQPDPDKRFQTLVLVAKTLADRGQLTQARRVVAMAAATIPLMGGVVETGMFAGLTALNAVHELVHFPHPDEWEGTTPENVKLARIPLQAICTLAPIAAQVDALTELAEIRHPFWELYAHLLPLVAVEVLAEEGEHILGAALLDKIPDATNEADLDRRHAEVYRRVIATAAVQRMDLAQTLLLSVEASYRPVAFRGLAKHLARQGRMKEAIRLVVTIEDATVADEATTDLSDVVTARADRDSCYDLMEFLLKKDWLVAAAWAAAAAGDPTLGLELLERAPQDDLRLGLGTKLGFILSERKQTEAAADIATRLIPVAERLLGPQWFAPETLDAEPKLTSLGSSLLLLVARAGLPIPEQAIPLSLVIENQTGYLADFKVGLLTNLAIANRFEDAMKLAEVSAVPVGRAFSLATILSIAGDGLDQEQLRTGVRELLDALKKVPPDSILDPALSVVMGELMSKGLLQEARQLMERLLPQPGLQQAVGRWAYEQGWREQAQDVRDVIRAWSKFQSAAEPTETFPLVRIAIASRQTPEPGELKAIEKSLQDVRTAAQSLDIVFELTGLYVAAGMTDVAAAFAGKVPGGKAGEVASRLEREDTVRWSDVSNQELTAVFLTRAVACAGMSVATNRTGADESARQWLARAHRQLELAGEMARSAQTNPAVQKYVSAAEASVLGEEAELPDASLAITTAFLLWDRKDEVHAVGLAKRALLAFVDPFKGLPQVISTGGFEEHYGVHAALHAVLGSLIARFEAKNGNVVEAKLIVANATEKVKSLGWRSLNSGAQSEIHASLALALHECGNGDAALKHLGEALSPAIALIERGDLTGFGRLCEAVVQILPREQSVPIWVSWLVAAGARGKLESNRLLSMLIRNLPEQDLGNATQSAKT